MATRGRGCTASLPGSSGGTGDRRCGSSGLSPGPGSIPPPSPSPTRSSTGSRRRVPAGSSRPRWRGCPRTSATCCCWSPAGSATRRPRWRSRCRRNGVVAPGPGAAQGPRGTRRAGPDPPGRGRTVIDEMEQLEQLCAAVPSPDRQRLAAARAQLSTAIRRETAGHAARRPRLAVSLALRRRWLGRRWLGWAAPIAAAAAVTGVILGSQGVFSPVHRPVPSSSTHNPGLVLPHPATAYVAGQSGTVTPILTAAGTALKPIRIGQDYGQISSAIVFGPDGKTAYVLSSTVLGGGSGTVTPIRTATNTALKPIAVGQDPRAMAITPDGATIYVTNYQSGTVTPIRTATGTALAPIRVGGNPWAIAIAPDGKTAYVADTQSGTVTPIRTATNTALAPIRVGR